ncbi:MAG TPA: 4Fe-4S binding protein, partial [Treponemataceae bacterium]|nr:4Fe-4S binding protein [Treponemataceae bacterium]
GKIAPDKCTVGGASCAEAIAKIMGVDLKPSWPYRPVVHCRAHYGDRLGRTEYRGEKTCTAANLVSGVQGCTYGCLGFGDCVVACDFDAIHIVDGLATVDYEKCVGCGACARACPRNIISMTPFKRGRMLAVACSNKDFGKDVKAVCKVGCIGCTACSRTSDLFKMDGKVARIDYDKYDPDQLESARVALSKCPARAIVEREKPLLASSGYISVSIAASSFDHMWPIITAAPFRSAIFMPVYTASTMESRSCMLSKNTARSHIVKPRSRATRGATVFAFVRESRKYIPLSRATSSTTPIATLSAVISEPSWLLIPETGPSSARFF